MEPIQILILIFALFALSRAVLRFKKNQISLGAFFFWLIIWAVIIIIDIFPGLVSSIARTIGITEGLGLIVYVSIILLFYLIFRLYVTVEHQNQTITQLVREVSIQEGKKKRK